MILGLDIGANSIGWCLVETIDAKPTKIVTAGVRCFDAGVEGDIGKGREESRNAKRRQARQTRRQTWRRQRRQAHLFRALQKAGLLPHTDSVTPQSIHDCLLGIDRTLRAVLTADDHIGQQVFLYRLRARAASERIEPHELGRAIYHLAQRRGFLSNRKAAAKEGEEAGQVRTGIATLEQAICDAKALTLGAYFALLDPDDERIRSRWTSRKMYEDEFDAIWRQQARHHPLLTSDLEREVRGAIFRQRPLKSQSDKIGRCELEPTCKRAPIALLSSQRFRLLQTVNHLRVLAPGAPSRALSPDERGRLIDLLEVEGDLTLAKAKRKLSLSGKARFSLEEGGETKLVGNRTNAKLRGIFGEPWNSLPASEKDRVVNDVITFDKPEALRKRGVRRWGLDADAAQRLADLTLEEGYLGHSTRAVMKLLPALEEGLAYQTVRQREYPGAFASGEPADRLPPVLSEKGLPELRNPAVARAISELRKIVNALIKEFGKPDLVRIELARDLKKARKHRQDASKRMRVRELERSRAVDRLLREARIPQPKRSDIEKVLLAEECGWRCPYTGISFSMRDLVGDSPRVDVDHILPFSRSLDDSFFNKTLCLHEENRNVKKNRAPFEAYGATPRWPEILQRVEAFKGPAAEEKLRRFKVEDLGPELTEDFVARQLNDTRYASTLAASYLGRLYGGLADANGRLRVQVSKGGATALLRNAWGLHSVLGDGGTKNRDDHRHHAVDAIVIALTGPAEVHALARASSQAWERGSRRTIAAIEPPWEGFLSNVHDAIDRITVSHRPRHRLSGALHEETLYSREFRRAGKAGRPEAVRHQRKPIDALSRADVDKIVDPRIREVVQRALAECGTDDPAKAFKERSAHPTFTAASGRAIPVHRVRVEVSKAVVSIGRGERARYVAPGSNHHMAIVAVAGADGTDQRWEGHVVTRLEAMERHRTGRPVVQREWGEGRTFVCSIASGDTVQITLPGEKPDYFVVGAVSGGRLELTRSRDARPVSEIKKSGVKGGRLLKAVDSLRALGLLKVGVSPIGVLNRAND